MCHCYLLNLVDLAEGCVSLISLLPPLIVFCYTPPLSSPRSQSFCFSEFVLNFPCHLSLTTECACFSTIAHYWCLLINASLLVLQPFPPCPLASQPFPPYNILEHALLLSPNPCHCPCTSKTSYCACQRELAWLVVFIPSHPHRQKKKNFVQFVLQIVFGLPDL